jgi:hypothetical protein
MRLGNPLLVEAWRGLTGSGRPQTAYVGYLAIQALALLVWWPWSRMEKLLGAHSEPKALVAVVVALGATVAFYSIRVGAEEMLLPGQSPLRDWVTGTPLAVGRIVSGYLGAHLLHTLHLLLLSSPLLVAGFAVSGATLAELAWCAVTVLFLATFYRLAGALIPCLLEHHAPPTSLTLHVVTLGSFGIAALALPAASHPVLCYGLLIEGGAMRFTAGGLPGHLVFIAVYATLSAMLTVALHRLLSRHRRGADTSGASSLHPEPASRGPS